MNDSTDSLESEKFPTGSGSSHSHNVDSITAATGKDITELASANPLEQKLLQRREHGEISKDALPFAYINDLFSDQMCPVMRCDLDTGTVPQAVVLTRAEVDALGCFAFVKADGQIEVINSEMMQSDKLILFPEDFGDMGYEDARDEFLEMFPKGLGMVM